MKLINSIVITTFLYLAFSFCSFAQVDTCMFSFKKHLIESKPLKETREYWVSLPMNYDSTKKYPVMYVLDAEWRFELIRNLAYDLSGNKKIPHHIIVGIPHVDWEFKRGQDLTFSHSRMEYDGEKVDSTWYNEGNSGKAKYFYEYLKNELMEDIDKNYPTSGQNVLIGHSYGGYFGAYLLSEKQPFRKMLLFDPSIWYSDGEAIEKMKDSTNMSDSTEVYISYQIEPVFHKEKIEELIELIKKHPQIKLSYRKFENETHNSLFIYSFLEGIIKVYED